MMIAVYSSDVVMRKNIPGTSDRNLIVPRPREIQIREFSRIHPRIPGNWSLLNSQREFPGILKNSELKCFSMLNSEVLSFCVT